MAVLLPQKASSRVKNYMETPNIMETLSYCSHYWKSWLPLSHEVKFIPLFPSHASHRELNEPHKEIFYCHNRYFLVQYFFICLILFKILRILCMTIPMLNVVISVLLRSFQSYPYTYLYASLKEFSDLHQISGKFLPCATCPAVVNGPPWLHEA